MSFSQVRKLIEPALLKTPGIVGVGGSKEELIVYVEGSPEIPEEIAGYPVKVIKAGHVVALSLLEIPWFEPAKPLHVERTEKIRPAPGGCSCGHYRISAGTLGGAIMIGGRIYGLSNNHVLACSSSFQHPRASVGDPITQPGPYDGARMPDDIIGRLARWVPLDEAGPNRVDAALFEPVDADMLSPEILEVGRPVGIGDVDVGDVVVKSGRTTGLTEAEVLDVNATMKVDYGAFTATFTDCIVTDCMAAGGDSGSWLIHKDRRDLVGLLFAGSNYVTMHCKIRNVLGELAAPRAVGAPPLLTGLMPVPVGITLISMFM